MMTESKNLGKEEEVKQIDKVEKPFVLNQDRIDRLIGSRGPNF